MSRRPRPWLVWMFSSLPHSACTTLLDDHLPCSSCLLSCSMQSCKKVSDPRIWIWGKNWKWGNIFGKIERKKWCEQKMHKSKTFPRILIWGTKNSPIFLIFFFFSSIFSSHHFFLSIFLNFLKNISPFSIFFPDPDPRIQHFLQLWWTAPRR